MPANENSIVGALLDCNGEVPPYLARLLDHAPESFDDQRAGLVADAIKHLRLGGKPVHTAAVIDHLKFPDALGFVIGCETAALPIAAAEFEAEEAWGKYQARRSAELLNEGMDALTAHPELAADTRRRIVGELQRLDSQTLNGLPEIVDAAEFLGAAIPMPAELVAGALHYGSKCAIGGNSKAFKTWILLDLAVAVATGAGWLGFPTCKGKVLFVNFEIQPAPWQRRIAAVTRAKGVELKAGQIQVWNLRGHAADFRQLIPKIITRAKSEGYALIILDPLYKLLGTADENSARDIAELLNAIERLAVDTKAAVAYANHFAKGNASGKEAQDRISGSGVFARDPDSLIIFTAHDNPGSFSVDTILRNFAPVDPFVVSWRFPIMERADNLDPADLKKSGGRGRVHTEETLLDALGNKSLTTTEWQTLAEDEHGIPRRTFYELKKALVSAGRVIQSAINNKWQKVNKTK